MPSPSHVTRGPGGPAACMDNACDEPSPAVSTQFRTHKVWKVHEEGLCPYICEHAGCGGVSICIHEVIRWQWSGPSNFPLPLPPPSSLLCQVSSVLCRRRKERKNRSLPTTPSFSWTWRWASSWVCGGRGDWYIISYSLHMAIYSVCYGTAHFSSF